MLRRVDVLKLFLVGGSSVLAQGIVTKGHPISGPYCLGIKPQLRKAKVDFELPVLDGGGKTMKFSDIPGKAVWLNFFASWCPSCNVEMPDILAMEAKYGQSGLTVIGVDVGETEQQARAFRDRHHVGFPILLDHDGAVFERLFNSNGIPTSLFYTSDRTLSCMVMDDLSRRSMDNEIAVALGH